MTLVVVQQDSPLDVSPVCTEYALEAVGCFALGSRLGTLQGEGDGAKITQLTGERK